jgi:predicted RNA-binding Zn ribbon-like protein
MRKRQQAPGELERVRAFVNTWDLEDDTDALATPEDLGSWLSEQGLASEPLAAGATDLRRARALREAIRGILLSHTDGAGAPAGAYRALDEAAVRARLALRFDERGEAQIEPEAGGVDGALGRLLRIVHLALAEGTWTRLKACREHTCEWAFYDHTKNRSGTWCTMEVCGNRAKARAYRERRPAPS